MRREGRTSVGGYASLVSDAVAMKDLSILAPLSVKDMIWVEVERTLVAEDELHMETMRHRMLNDRFDHLEMFLADVRHILTMTEFDARLAAVKGGRTVRKMKPIDPKTLPSVEMAKSKEERELTEEQKAQRDREKMERTKLRMEHLRQMQEIQQLLEGADTPEQIAEATREFEDRYGTM